MKLFLHFSLDLVTKIFVVILAFKFVRRKGSTHWLEWVPIKRFEKSESILFPSLLINRLKGCHKLRHKFVISCDMDLSQVYQIATVID